MVKRIKNKIKIQWGMSLLYEYKNLFISFWYSSFFVRINKEVMTKKLDWTFTQKNIFK